MRDIVGTVGPVSMALVMTFVITMREFLMKQVVVRKTITPL